MVKPRQPSVKVRPKWEVIHEIDFTQLSKLNFKPPDPEELWVDGILDLFPPPPSDTPLSSPPPLSPSQATVWFPGGVWYLKGEEDWCQDSSPSQRLRQDLSQSHYNRWPCHQRGTLYVHTSLICTPHLSNLYTCVRSLPLHNPPPWNHDTTKDKMIGPKVSFIWSFHCTTLWNDRRKKIVLLGHPSEHFYWSQGWLVRVHCIRK